MVSEIKYRYDFIGLSTDNKPTPSDSNEVVDGSTYYESDTSKLYVWYNSQWYEKVSTGGGGTSYTAGDGIDITSGVISATNTGKIKTLSQDDYNWNYSTQSTTEPNCIAFWLLDDGIYRTESNVSGNYEVMVAGNLSYATTYGEMVFIVSHRMTDDSEYGEAKVTTITGVTWYQILQWNYNYNMSEQNAWAWGGEIHFATGPELEETISQLIVVRDTTPTEYDYAQPGCLWVYSNPEATPPEGAVYLCLTNDPITWEQISGGGGGSEFTILTDSDANYTDPDSGDEYIALWMLPTGRYMIDKNATVPMLIGLADDGTGTGTLIPDAQLGPETSAIALIDNELEPTSGVSIAGYGTSFSGVFITDYTTGEITDSTYFSGSFVGADSSNNGRTGLVPAPAIAEADYFLKGDGTWQPVQAPTVVQTTGTSTTNVMSQNAVTSMVFADPSARTKVKIGDSTYTQAGGNDAVAIGFNARANSAGAVAIGAGANATSKGVFAIGASSTSHGYNNSNYRLLTGLYDPQSAHDAATKGYVDPTSDSSAPTTATVGRLGQIQIDTTTSTAYMCVAVDDVTPAYTWRQITA